MLFDMDVLKTYQAPFAMINGWIESLGDFFSLCGEMVFMIDDYFISFAAIIAEDE